MLLEKDIDGSIRHESLKPGALVSRTQVARFHIGRHHPEDCISKVKRLCHHCDILDEAMLSCGYIVNVMLIGRRSSGMSYRMGVGWILMRSWVKAERRFEIVVLE